MLPLLCSAYQRPRFLYVTSLSLSPPAAASLSLSQIFSFLFCFTTSALIANGFNDRAPHLPRLPVLPEPPRDVEEEGLHHSRYVVPVVSTQSGEEETLQYSACCERKPCNVSSAARSGLALLGIQHTTMFLKYFECFGMRLCNPVACSYIFTAYSPLLVWMQKDETWQGGLNAVERIFWMLWWRQTPQVKCSGRRTSMFWMHVRRNSNVLGCMCRETSMFKMRVRRNSEVLNACERKLQCFECMCRETPIFDCMYRETPMFWITMLIKSNS